ncbi:hypothetical protein FOA52_013198 [Chlamydomonas sp. UWO 241]|nr:hypothetical protein FOA52_013198 [Chlamydomonas sp. UWO 241]
MSGSTSEARAALPIKRRGSYLLMKRERSALSSEDEPSVMGLLTNRKPTHWERFGTVMVLCCLAPDSPEGTACMQMLQAEGYDTLTTSCLADAMTLFSTGEVFPDVVLVDCDARAFASIALIAKLQGLNATTAILLMGTRGGVVSPEAALQAGATDFMARPVDLDEMIARIERHVLRQHAIKLELEAALEEAQRKLAQLGTATLLGNIALGNRGAGSPAGSSGGVGTALLHTGQLVAVAETDFEQQITELSEENQKLDSKLQEMEWKLGLKDNENRVLAEKLGSLGQRMDTSRETSDGMQAQLNLMHKQNTVFTTKADDCTC